MTMDQQQTGIHQLIEIERKKQSAAQTDEPLIYVDLTAPLKDRQWLVRDRIPMFNVTSLAGEGSVGKSLLLLQLSAAVVLGRDWLGTSPITGAVLYICAEEDDDELNRRLEDIAQHYSAGRQQLGDGGLRVLSFAGRDAILGQPDRDGIIKPTALLERIKRAALALRPKLIVIDPVADAFAGKEIDRSQTRQFVTLMRGLAIDAASAVVMAAHPSLTGIASGSGLSGSTAWHNSVRARMYFQTVQNEDGEENPDPTLRVLECKKNQYGPPSEQIFVRWERGVYVLRDPAQADLDLNDSGTVVEHLFLTLLRRFTEQDRNVSDKRSPTYAPTLFAEQPEAKRAKPKVTPRAFADAMERLFAAQRLKLVTDGPPSRRRTRIVEASDAPSNTPIPTPFQHLPTPSNTLSTHTPPYPPSPLEAGKGALEAPPAPTGGSAGPPYEILGAAPPGQRCIRCGKGGYVSLIRRHGREVDVWHPACIELSIAAAASPSFKLPDLGPDSLDEHGAPLTYRKQHKPQET
jgi:RecA-family ATPase